MNDPFDIAQDFLPTQVVDMMAASLLLAGEYQSLERFLEMHESSSSDVYYHLGVEIAKKEDYSKAVVYLKKSFSMEQNNPELKKMLVDVLTAAAIHSAKQGDHLTAESHFREALECDPGNLEIQGHLRTLQYALPGQYLMQGDTGMAVRILTEMQGENPLDYHLAHQLAISCHRQAIEKELKGEYAEATPLWLKALANWVFVVESDEFWKEWVGEQESVYCQPIKPQAVDTLRQKNITTRLERIHRDFEADYHVSNMKDKKDRIDQHREYRLALDLEVKAARTVKELFDTRQDSFPAAGPLYYQESGLMEKITAALVDIQKLNPKAEGPVKLLNYLSPLGACHLLLEEKQFDQAIDRLNAILAKSPKNADAKKLKTEATKLKKAAQSKKV